ncbi:MAG: tRNA (adenosine(37)-N6)-threonylcarbamoyltransferase complex transferase subunit TsaD [Bacteroidetes bacterium]|nr:tRNA (adenosine(37)-N6)-threonylcarbamoyltransferase complex transferase subunit TsaD [Bacteroidota bacterium]
MQKNERVVQNITLLAIETSCDDTSASVIKNGEILSNVVSSQSVHIKYGGVVPELASRAHQKNIIPVVNHALQISKTQLKNIDAIAYTIGPGLLGSLLVGSSFAKGLAISLNKPLISVNHLEAHVLAPLIENRNLQFPYLCLLVSGGHTQIILVNSITDFEIIGKTIDDAAGEAFDKTAKIIGLPYPGGPLIDKYSQNGNHDAFKFAIGKVPGLDLSFSGFKTSVLYFIQKQSKKDATFVQNNLSDICSSIRKTIITYLMTKLSLAVKQTGINRVSIAGGVAANSLLRNEIIKKTETENWQVFIPKLEFCTDNAAMVAFAAYAKMKIEKFSPLDEAPFASFK